MFNLKVFPLEAYRIPTESAFQQRKIFHSSVKSATESIEDWFRRTEECISGCDFGDLSDFLLIDKFISGLNDEIFQQFTVHSTLTMKESLSKALAYDLLTNDIKDVKIRPPSSDDFLQLERIKVEQVDEPHLGDLYDQDSINGQELNLFEDTSDDDVMASIVKKRKKEARNSTNKQSEVFEVDNILPNQSQDDSDFIEFKGFEISDEGHAVNSKYSPLQLIGYHLYNFYDQHCVNDQEEDLSDNNIIANIPEKRKKKKIQISPFKEKICAKKHSERFDKYNMTSSQTQNERDAIELKGFEIDDQKRVVCLDCGKCFLSKRSYIRHQPIHTGKDLHICNVCEKVFTIEYGFKRHMLTHLHDKKSLECYMCSVKFRNIHALKSHIRFKHVAAVTIKRGLFKCTNCEKTFSTHVGLNLHKRMHQSEVRSVMLLHALNHAGKQNFVCDTCGKSFKTQTSLTIHMLVHTDERSYKCDLCGKMMKYETSLKHHMRLHSGERPFKCELCEKTFAHRSNLRIHLKIHRDDRRHACTLCDKRFVTLYNLNVHMLIHTGEKPYQCDRCDKAFTQAVTLRSHTSKRHKL